MTDRILIVDDQQPIRELLKMTLDGLAEVVGECCDGSEALDAYRLHSPDWVLMDLMMPQVDGIAATREIKSDYPAAKIIIVTSHESAVMREAAEKAGACAYVLKENLLDLRGLTNH